MKKLPPATENSFIDLLNNFFKKNEFTALALQKFKNSLAKQNKQSTPRRNSDILAIYRGLLKEKKISKSSELERLLRIRKVRTSSGVSVVSLLTKSFPCPGECTFCPTEKNMPKSYLSNEPAVMRAIRSKFSPGRQTMVRLMMLEKTGHKTEKIELIIMGGTFSYLPKSYRTNYIRSVLNTLNSLEIKKQKSQGFSNLDLEKAKTKNKNSKHKCVGLTLETRPDFVTEKELIDFRRLGCTRVEIGVQSLSDEVLKKTKRGHGVSESIRATKLLKDAGFKIVYHLMPGLPGSSVKDDIAMIKQVFNDENFQPDWLKIYPCVVTKNCELYEDVKKGLFKPLDKEGITSILVEAKKHIPSYVRLNRIIRDIPSTSIEFGSKVTNLRQELEGKVNCRCIRCREIRERDFDEKDLVLKKQEYLASGGKEFFLSFEDAKNDKIISLLRLRIPSQIFSREKHFIPALQDASIIREVHTFGIEENIGQRKENSQHKGLGKRLLEEAEKISREMGIKKIAVIAGVGVRGYYEKLGYRLEGEYMVKGLVIAEGQ